MLKFNPFSSQLDEVVSVDFTGVISYKGAYAGATDYAVGDSVDYLGSSYVMFADAVAGTLPTDTTYWQVLANKGNTGATGADSTVAGPAGADGLTTSVNGVTQVAGAITLTQDDIGDGTTYKQYSATEKTKLSGIATGAEVNVQSDWTQATDTTDDYIKNKPTLGTAAAENIGAFAPALGADDNYVTDTEKTVIGNTSNTNSGDNATNTQYSGLAASKVDTDQTTPQTIGLTGARLAKLWATDIDCTNAIVASITGNAATVTNGVYTNAANTFNQINPLITPAESWIGPSTTTGVYFKGGKVGIGTTSPNFPLTVTDGSIPEASAVGITGRGISYQGAGSAYFMGRDMTNDIEFIMGTSTVGEAFAGSMTAHDLDFRTGNKRGRIHIVHATGNVGIGIIAPTAKLHLAAGTATASTAPLKFTSGVLNTTAGAGAVEFLTDKYYGTITTGAARKTFAFLESPIFTTPTLGVATATRIGVGVAADATRVFVSAATSAAELPLYERTGGTSNDPLGSVFLLATKTTDMSNGFGVTQVFQIKDDAGVANTIGVVGFVRDGADNTGKYVVRPYALGVQGTDKFTVDSAGHVLLEGVTSTGATGTGKFVFDTSPTLAAPVIKNYTTALAPTYAKGALYFDTTLNKLRVGGATAWETITSTQDKL